MIWPLEGPFFLVTFAQKCPFSDQKNGTSSGHEWLIGCKFKKRCNVGHPNDHPFEHQDNDNYHDNHDYDHIAHDDDQTR